MQKRQPKGTKPVQVKTVDNEQFQVVGEEKLYSDPIDANRRSRKKGAGSQVKRMSDGKIISVVPDYIPAMPMSD